MSTPPPTSGFCFCEVCTSLVHVVTTAVNSLFQENVFFFFFLDIIHISGSYNLLTLSSEKLPQSEWGRGMTYLYNIGLRISLSLTLTSQGSLLSTERSLSDQSCKAQWIYSKMYSGFRHVKACWEVFLNGLKYKYRGATIL